MMTEDLIIEISGYAGMIIALIGAVFIHYYNESGKKNKAHFKRAIACFVIGAAGLGVSLNMAGVTLEGMLDSSSACNCEKELYTWAIGGNTFNTTLKVDCLEKYNGPDYMGVYHKMDGVTNNLTFMNAWDKAKEECESKK